MVFNFEGTHYEPNALNCNVMLVTIKVWHAENFKFYLSGKVNKQVCNSSFWSLDTAKLPADSTIKALTALVGRLSLSVGLENDLERGLKTVNP